MSYVRELSVKYELTFYSTTVYKHVLANSKPVHINHPLFPIEYDTDESELTQFQPALLLVNRQVSKEAIVVLYGEQNFTMTNPLFEPGLHIDEFVEFIGSTNMSLIRNLTFEVDYCCDYKCDNWPEIFDSVLGGGSKSQKLDTLTFVLTDDCKDVLPHRDWVERWFTSVVPLLDTVMDRVEAHEIILRGDCPKEYLKDIKENKLIKYVGGEQDAMKEEELEDEVEEELEEEFGEEVEEEL